MAVITTDELAAMTKGGFDEATTRFDSIDEQLGGLKTDVADLKTDVGVLKTDVAGLKTDVGVLKTDVAGLKADIAEIKVVLLDIQKILKGLAMNFAVQVQQNALFDARLKRLEFGA